jgi:hypothetical protein
MIQKGKDNRDNDEENEETEHFNSADHADEGDYAMEDQDRRHECSADLNHNPTSRGVVIKSKTDLGAEVFLVPSHGKHAHA